MCTLHAWRVCYVICVCLARIEICIGGSDKGIVLNDLALVFRFGLIFKKCFKGKFGKSNEHLWQQVNTEIANFQMLTYEWDMGTPIDVLRTGSHLRMLLYALNELFYMYRGVGVNDTDRQHVVAYEILKVVSLHCTVAKRRSVTLLGLLTQG